MDPDKRQLRQLKRHIKKAGSRHRRRQLQRDLADNPGEAHHSEEDLGRLESKTMNRLDNDATRKRSNGEPPA